LEFTSVVALGSPSAGFPITNAGTYQWQAVYTSTNGQNNNATSLCGSEIFTVNSNSPTLITTAQVSTDGGTIYSPITGNIAIGNMVRDTSTLSGAATPVAGTVVYTLYSGNGCDSNAPTGTVEFQTGSLPVTSATLPDSGSFTVTTAGDYQWQAVFTSTNGQNNNATSQCGTEDFTVSPNSPTLSTTAQSSTDNVTFSDMTGPVVIGTFVRDTSSLSGAATPTTGSVAYRLYTGTGCSDNVPTGTVIFTDTETLANNAIPPSASVQLNTAGDYQWQAVYTSGNGQNNNATSPCGSEAFTVTTPNFTILKTDVPGDTLPVTPGSTIPYTITVQNVGNGPGTATIQDVLPSSLTMSGAPACTVTDPSTDACTVPSSAVSTLDATVTLAAGDTATITFSAVLDKTDTADVVNTASIKTGVCTPDQGLQPSIKSHAVTIQCSSTVTNPVPNFTVTKTDTPGNGQSVTPGSTIPYTVAIKNVGDGAGSATITDTLPSSLTIQGTPQCAVTGTDTCTVTNTSGSTWTFAVDLAAGNTATVTFSAKVAATATGSIVNTATITTGPCNTTSGCSSTVSNPIPPVTSPAATTTTTTTPPVVKPSAIAFTGADIAGMAAGGLALVGLGGFLVLLSRRRRRSAGETA
jgi:fimbrial isopeptide formation D2 family protein